MLSKYLLISSSKVTRFVDDLHIKNKHHELQKLKKYSRIKDIEDVPIHSIYQVLTGYKVYDGRDLKENKLSSSKENSATDNVLNLTEGLPIISHNTGKSETNSNPLVTANDNKQAHFLSGIMIKEKDNSTLTKNNVHNVKENKTLLLLKSLR